MQSLTNNTHLDYAFASMLQLWTFVADQALAEKLFDRHVPIEELHSDASLYVANVAFKL